MEEKISGVSCPHCGRYEGMGFRKFNSIRRIRRKISAH